MGTVALFGAGDIGGAILRLQVGYPDATRLRAFDVDVRRLGHRRLPRPAHQTMKAVLGYDCPVLHPHEAEARAAELKERLAALARQSGGA